MKDFALQAVNLHIKFPVFMREFAARHLGPDDTQLQSMIEKIGVSSLDELINKTIPPGIRNKKELNLGEGLTEYDYLKAYLGSG
jgi:glycine dehydrogenase